jgi:hypothetical protein
LSVLCFHKEEAAMDESVFQQPTPEQLRQFVQGDPLAIDAVIRLVLPQLYRWGIRRYQQVPEDDVKDVIHEVLGETCEHYARYDPARAKFTTYVIDLIIKRLATVQNKRIKRVKTEKSEEDSSEKLPEPMYNDSEVDVIRRIDRAAFFRYAHKRLSEIEVTFLDLMLAGEIHQEPFVAVLTRSGIAITDVDVNREVNKVKNRLKYKLQRAAQDLNLRLEDLL